MPGAVDTKAIPADVCCNKGTAMTPADLDCVNTVRLLAAALPQAANSGHPGAPMGCAPMAHVLWGYVMNYSPKDPQWINRDRFVLSNGHGCALLYTMLHLTGYPLSMDDLKNFRQLNSKTPGHPESHTPGIEVTTGPLGQGISQAVGLAMASAHFANKYNKPDVPPVFDNFTYVIVGDGCLQEGVSSEACSLAGHWKLGHLIALYDSNKISIDGDTSLSFTEDVANRFQAYGWHVNVVENGDTDLTAIMHAICKEKTRLDKPSLIVVKTTIGFGSTKQGTAKTHGAPLGLDDIKQAREKFNLSGDMWTVNESALNFYRQSGAAGDAKRSQWTSTVWEAYKAKHPTEAAEIDRRFKGELPANWEKALPVFTPESAAMATRASSHAVLNALAPVIPEIVGGSADLTESNKSDMKGEKDFNDTNYQGRYFRFGVREHAMAAIINGLDAYGGLRPYGATFLNFIGYAWGAVRLSAISGFGVLHIATHDSIELGEDGPTHQPVELLPLLRATPNLLAVRPADANECSGAYAVWLRNPRRPTVMALCRANVPNLPNTSVAGVMKGGYVLQDFDAEKLKTPGIKRAVLAGSGSEVQLCVAAKLLLEQNADITARVVSMPCWELFEEQSGEYKRSVLVDRPHSADSASTLALLYCEAASTVGFDRYFHLHVGMTSFGASAPKDALWNHFGFTKENIANKVLAHFGKK